MSMAAKKRPNLAGEKWSALRLRSGVHQVKKVGNCDRPAFRPDCRLSFCLRCTISLGFHLEDDRSSRPGSGCSGGRLVITVPFKLVRAKTPTTVKDEVLQTLI
jgi:hypothetical protein